MKLSLAVWGVLVALALAGIVWAHGAVNAERDQVRFTETVLLGENSAVEGVRVKSRAHLDSHLFWESLYTAGPAPTAETTYDFYAIAQREVVPQKYQGVLLECNLSIEIGEPEKEAAGLQRVYQELLDSIEVGGEKTVIVRLRDHYEYYPLQVHLDLPGVDWYGRSGRSGAGERAERLIDTFAEFFTIPMLEGERLEISAWKEAGGYGMGSGSVEGSESFRPAVMSALTEDSVYFAFDAHTDRGNLVDLSHIPGGYGVYRLPIETEAGSVTEVLENELAMVYPLDPAGTFQGIHTHPAGEELLLFTAEEGNFWLTVLDAGTLETLQRLPFAGWDGEAWIVSCFLYEDFLVLELSGGRLALLTREGAGGYNVRFVTEITDHEEPLYSLREQAAMDWDGERLLVCQQLREGWAHDSANGFVLAVYDESGLAFFGEYQSSLDTGGSDEPYDYYCHPMSHEPFIAEWRG